MRTTATVFEQFNQPVCVFYEFLLLFGVKTRDVLGIIKGLKGGRIKEKEYLFE